MWPNGVMFTALAAAARHEPETYRPVMERFFTALDGYRDAKAKVPGYEPSPVAGGTGDKYYDDNAWMVITLLEAHELTRDNRYRARAEQALRFVLSGWDDQAGGGIWWHEGHKDGAKNT
ncbi:MAG: glycoside hydrolase family 76 protein [Kiritimatiellia bacterium]